MDPSANQDNFVGRSIGAYGVVRRIGAGGMGAVYEGRHRQTGRRVAIKVLNREMAQDPMLLERFRREARITASLTSPHVVKVLEFDQLPDGVPYMVMEFLEGEDLEARLKRQKRLGADPALELLRGATAALSEAHAAGVVHRDIKPGNLFYAREGSGERVKLLDFGISKASNLTGDGLTVFGQVLGTIWYMSPEQANGGELSTASDVYSLAVVLFEALSGQLPFEARMPVEYLLKLQSESPRSLLSVAPELPLALDGVFARALAREPALRTARVEDFAREVEDTFTLGNEQTSVRRVSEPAMRVAAPRTQKVVTGARIPASRAPETTVPATRQRTGARSPTTVSDEGSTRVARVNTPPTPIEARSAHEPTTLDEDEPEDRSLPPVMDATYTPFTAPEADLADSTRVMPAPAEPVDDGATRVVSLSSPHDDGATRVTSAPRRPDTMPTPPAEPDEAGPTVLHTPLQRPKPTSGTMRARQAVRGSEEDPEASRFTPPLGVPAVGDATVAFDAGGGPRRVADLADEPDEPTATGVSALPAGTETWRRPASRPPARSNGHVVALGIALGLGLLVVLGGLAWFVLHR